MWLSWLECCSRHWKVEGLIPGQGICLVVGPQSGHIREATDQCFSHIIYWSVQKVSSHVLWKIEIFIEGDTRHKKHCTQDYDTLASFKVGTLGLHTVLPVVIFCPSYFPESHQQSEMSSLSKVILVLGKSRSHRVQNLSCRCSWVTWCFTKKLCRRHDAWAAHCRDEAASHQLPIALAF